MFSLLTPHLTFSVRTRPRERAVEERGSEIFSRKGGEVEGGARKKNAKPAERRCPGSRQANFLVRCRCQVGVCLSSRLSSSRHSLFLIFGQLHVHTAISRVWFRSRALVKRSTWYLLAKRKLGRRRGSCLSKRQLKRKARGSSRFLSLFYSDGLCVFSNALFLSARWNRPHLELSWHAQFMLDRLTPCRADRVHPTALSAHPSSRSSSISIQTTGGRKGLKERLDRGTRVHFRRMTGGRTKFPHDLDQEGER